MPVYRASINGMRPVLLRGESRPKAIEQLVSIEPLSGEQMADALAAGETIFKTGDRVEAEEPPKGEAAPAKE